MDWLVTLVREIGVDETRRLIGILIALVGGYGVFLIIRRGNKDGDTIRRALEREQEENTRLLERLNQIEDRLNQCENRLQENKQ